MFFLAKDGNRYALNRVVHYRVDTKCTVSVKLNGMEQAVLVDEVHWDQALAQTAQAFSPAHRGTYALWLWRDETGKVAGYNRTNIIGWSIGADGYAHGWTIDGVDHGQADMPAILHPDGRVEVCFDKVHDNVVEWFAEAKA